MFKYLIFFILAIGFFVRIAGIGYGLPFALVGDETPFVYGVLKMMELKTIAPAFHLDEFKTVLYFPPYLCYLYLIPFGILTLVKFLFFAGNFSEFKNFLIVDPSQFFIMARFFSVVLGTATIWFIYKAGKNIFKSEAAGLFSAAFFSFSFLHVNFSHWARHWVPVTFIFSLIIFILSKEDLSKKKKYFVCLILAGIGAGFNYQAALAGFFIFLWFVFYDNFLKNLKEKWIYAAAGLFLALACFAYLIYPAGLVVNDRTISDHAKSFTGFFNGYLFYFNNLLISEPVFLLFIISGFVFAYFYKRRYFLINFLFSVFYIGFFYVVFFHVDRYILMLYPVFSLMAGYGLWRALERVPVRVREAAIVFVFAAMLIPVLKFDLLLLKNDTRVQAANKIYSTISENSKIAVLAPSMRISATEEAVKEQGDIDPSSLRRVDVAELALGEQFLGHSRYNALNLYAVNSGFFYDNFADYMKKNGFQYVVFDQEMAKKRGIADYLNNAGREIAVFDGLKDDNSDITNGFGGGLKNIFSLKSNGPKIIIIKL